MLNDPRTVLNATDQLNTVHRLQQLMDQWKNNPGSRPGGTGKTGLSVGDKTGWSRMQDENIWGQNALRGLQNLGPLSIEARPSPNNITMNAAPGTGMSPDMLVNQPGADALRGNAPTANQAILGLSSARGRAQYLDNQDAMRRRRP
jgi:hypothetical protein